MYINLEISKVKISYLIILYLNIQILILAK